MDSGARPVHIPRRHLAEGRAGTGARNVSCASRTEVISVPGRGTEVPRSSVCTESPEQPLNHGLPVLEDAPHVAMDPRHQERVLQETEVQPVTHDVGQPCAGTAVLERVGVMPLGIGAEELRVDKPVRWIPLLDARAP